MGKFEDKTDMYFGRIKVLAKDITIGRPNKTSWICLCECGSVVTIPSKTLSSGDAKSCGCLRAEKMGSVNRSHSMSSSPEYKTWQSMKDRCSNPNNPAYHRYGGDGIKYCESWNEFENFYSDMGERPSGATLDRIDCFKGYYPENCRWATKEVQSGNRKKNILFEGQLATRSNIARKSGVNRSSLQNLLEKGLTPEDAVYHLQSLRK